MSSTFAHIAQERRPQNHKNRAKDRVQAGHRLVIAEIERELGCEHRLADCTAPQHIPERAVEARFD